MALTVVDMLYYGASASYCYLIKYQKEMSAEWLYFQAALYQWGAAMLQFNEKGACVMEIWKHNVTA